MLCISCTGSTAVTAALPSAASNAWESRRLSTAAGTAQLQAQHNCLPPTCTWEAATLLCALPNPAARWDLSGPAAQQRRMQQSTGGESCKVERGTSPLQNRNPRDCKTRSASIGCGWRRKCFSFLLVKKNSQSCSRPQAAGTRLERANGAGHGQHAMLHGAGS